ncbi:cyclic GMP-AMP synthase DncV-like nucleotidyltransferase [Spirosoma fluminis]
MVVTPPTNYSSLLLKIAQTLDITPSQYDKAVAHYQAVGKWLDAADSPLAIYKPVIHPQGSLRYGTVIKPLSNQDEYDIDLVCKLQINKLLVSQQTLKKMVGDRLKANKDYLRMLDKEGRRCWRLDYNEAERFHLDILPAIPDAYDWLLLAGVPIELAQHALCITDRETWGTDIDWPRANPEGYARWFYSRMHVAFALAQQTLANEMRMKVEDVPAHRVKTVLQQVVQLLKRHRDIMLGDDEDKPISIIITTLAAWAYQNETDLLSAMKNVLAVIPGLIRFERGEFIVENPVNPLENFADKWKDNPKKAEKFFTWVNQAQLDFNKLEQLRGLPNVAVNLKAQFGEDIVTRALNSLGDETRQVRESGNLSMERGTGLLSSAAGGIKVSNHHFYGSR